VVVRVLGDRVLEKLLNEVNVGHDHAAAAVTLKAQLVHSITALY
jgi:hypothetical protein